MCSPSWWIFHRDSISSSYDSLRAYTPNPLQRAGHTDLDPACLLAPNCRRAGRSDGAGHETRRANQHDPRDPVTGPREEGVIHRRHGERVGSEDHRIHHSQPGDRRSRGVVWDSVDSPATGSGGDRTRGPRKSLEAGADRTRWEMDPEGAAVSPVPPCGATSRAFRAGFGAEGAASD